MPERFWSDDFDMDLLKLFPDLPDRLGAMANVPMWTHGGVSHGRLNMPSAWNGYKGLETFFGLRPESTGKPEGYSTTQLVVECTWLEVLRDAWPHTYRLIVDGQWLVWDTSRAWPVFYKIMCDLRGHQKLPDGEADRLRGRVLASVLAATRDLTSILNRVAEVPDAS